MSYQRLGADGSQGRKRPRGRQDTPIDSNIDQQFGYDGGRARKRFRHEDDMMQSNANSSVAFFPNSSGVSVSKSAFTSYSGTHTHIHYDSDLLKQHNGPSHDAAHSGSVFATSWDTITKRCDDQDPKALLDGARVISREDISLTKEICKGQGYRLHSAHISGKAVAVKVYERTNAKERCLEAAKFHRSVLHPTIPQMMGISAINSDLTFLVFSGEYEAPIEYIIAQALTKDLERSLRLGFQTVASLSSGLDYLDSIDYDFASASLEDFNVFFSRQGNILISFDPEVPHEVEKQNSRHDHLDDSVWAVAAFHRLCQKIFDAARKRHYQNQQIQHTYDDQELLDDEQSFPTSKPVNGQPLQELSSKLHPNASLKTVQRRELVWKTPGNALIALEDISCKFQEVLDQASGAPELTLNRRRGRNVAGAVHRCQGYNRLEIMLTADVTQSAIVSHSTPTPHEICPVCKAVVDDAEIFNCICGGYDDDSIPTVRCSTCFEWHHQPCATELPEQPFVCPRCHQIEEMKGVPVSDGEDGVQMHEMPKGGVSMVDTLSNVERRGHDRDADPHPPPSSSLPSLSSALSNSATADSRRLRDVGQAHAESSGSSSAHQKIELSRPTGSSARSFFDDHEVIPIVTLPLPGDSEPLMSAPTLPPIRPAADWHAAWGKRARIVPDKGTPQSTSSGTKIFACNFCRARRTKCDGAHPVCGSCARRQLDCNYMLDSTTTGSSTSNAGAAALPKIQSSRPADSSARSFFADLEMPPIVTPPLPEDLELLISTLAPTLPLIRRASDLQAAQRKRETTAPGKGAPQSTSSGTKIFACNFCRARKTKCDGAHPVCGSCARRQLDCSYVRDSTTTDSSTSNGAASAQNKGLRSSM